MVQLSMNDILQSITDFIFVQDEPVPADVIMAVGGSLPEAAEKAAELWKAGFAPYVLIGGKYSIKSERFPGPKSKADIYDKPYETEYDFYLDVLLKNGVLASAVIGENRSSFTRQNAEYAKVVLEDHAISAERILLVCKSFHARRCLMFYKSSFPASDIRVIPFDGFGISRENWYKTDGGIERVLGELSRCGSQFRIDDIRNFRTL